MKRKPVISCLKWTLLLVVCYLSVPHFLRATTIDIGTFSNPQKYGWTNEEIRLNERDNLFMETLLLDEYNSLKKPTVLNALKTSIAPGWGHYTVGSYTKGHVFLGLQLVLVGSSLYYREKAMIEYRKYEKATQIEEINATYENALVPYRQSNLLLSLLVVVWGYTIYDVIVETNNYNYELWDQLNAGSSSARLSITPTSITLRF